MRIEAGKNCTMISTLRSNQARGPWLRLLSEVLQLAGTHVEFLRHSEKPWSSSTFSGTRHHIAICFNGIEAITEGENFITALPDHEFNVPGQLVADAAIASAEHTTIPHAKLTVEVELLLLEDL